MLLSFLLAFSVKNPEAEEAWYHNTDFDEAEPLSMPTHTDYAAHEVSLWLCHNVPWPFLFPSLKKTQKQKDKEVLSSLYTVWISISLYYFIICKNHNFIEYILYVEFYEKLFNSSTDTTTKRRMIYSIICSDSK